MSEPTADACSNASFDIPGTGISVTPNNLQAGVGILAAFLQYDNWSDDVDKVMSLAQDYADLAEDYKVKDKQARELGDAAYDYGKSIAPFEQCHTYAGKAGIRSLIQARQLGRQEYMTIDADDCGARCDVVQDMAKINIIGGTARHYDGHIFERNMTDSRLRARMSGMLGAMNFNMPNLSGGFNVVADNYVRQMQESSVAFNSALAFTGSALTASINERRLARFRQGRSASGSLQDNG